MTQSCNASTLQFAVWPASEFHPIRPVCNDNPRTLYGIDTLNALTYDGS